MILDSEQQREMFRLGLNSITSRGVDGARAIVATADALEAAAVATPPGAPAGAPPPAAE
jgi:hypothetical protein